MDECLLLHAYLTATSSTGFVVDVGAHQGQSSLPFLQSGWTVYAFEPDAVNRRALTALLAGFPNLFVDSRAVSDQVRTMVPFYTSSVSSGISGLTRFHASHEQTGVVDTTTLDAFCVERNIKELTFLKTDTEGYDLPVLRGFPWARMSPQIALCEFEDRKTVPLGYCFHDLAGFLVDHGYKVLVSEWYPIVEYGRQHRWRRFAQYPCELADPAAWGNLLAFRDGIDWGRLMTAVAKVGGQRTDVGGQMSEVSEWEREKLQALREQVRYMQHSLSWRMTAPLRRVMACARRWVRRLEPELKKGDWR